MQFQCQLCGVGVSAQLGCAQCGAVYYCSEKHARIAARMGHAEECGRMQQQMARLEVRVALDERPGSKEKLL